MVNLSLNASLQKLVTFVFSVMTVGGILLIAYGCVTLVKAFSSQDSSGSELAKGIGCVMGGITMCCIHYLVGLFVGSTDLSTFTFVDM